MDDMNRRTVLATAGVVGGVGLSGCLGLVDGLTTFEASVADVDESALSETGYDETGVDEIVNERTFEAAGESETVEVTSYLAEHAKQIDMGPIGEQETATFSVLSSPKVEAVGRSFNPIEEMSTEEIVELIEDNYDDIGELNRESDHEITLVDQTVDESIFSAPASIDGQPFDLALHVTTAAERGDDFVLAIGAYPQEVESQEKPNIRTLIEAVTPADDREDSDEAEDEDDTTNGEAEDGDDGLLGEDDADDENDAGDDNDTDEQSDDEGLLGL